jgi:hypothetical protein
VSDPFSGLGYLRRAKGSPGIRFARSNRRPSAVKVGLGRELWAHFLSMFKRKKTNPLWDKNGL